jgi:hypothetical protein
VQKVLENERKIQGKKLERWGGYSRKSIGKAKKKKQWKIKAKVKKGRKTKEMGLLF